MKTRIPVFAVRRHICSWLMAFCLLGSIAVRIFLHDGSAVWTGVILPAAAAALYVLIVLLAGDAFFYKTALPVWLAGICGAVELYKPLAHNVPLFCAACAGIAVWCILYTMIADGRTRSPLWLAPLAMPALAVLIFIGLRGSFASVLADLLGCAGMLALLPALKGCTDGKFHPTWGDRIDGRRIRSAPAMEQITPYFMVDRTGANNLFAASVDIEQLERYVHQKRREGLNNFGLSHVIMAAYVRTVAKYPALNRFIGGQKIYSRGEDIILCMTVKKEMTASAPDSVLKVHLHPGDTAEQVYTKYLIQLEDAKNTMENSGTDSAAGAFMLIPGLVLKFAIWLLKTMDYFGLLPRFLLEVSPFHGSVYFTSMGSLGIPPVYHHLYDFGTVPVFCSFGRKRRAEELVNGEPTVRRYVDLKFNLDERICDGFYYAGVIKYFLRLLNHPEQLDAPPETIERDIP